MAEPPTKAPDPADAPREAQDALMDREEQVPSFGRGFPRVRSAPPSPALLSNSASAIANELAAPLPRVDERPDETTPPVDPELLQRFRAVPAIPSDASRNSAADRPAGVEPGNSAFAQTNITAAAGDAPTLVDGIDAAERVARQRALNRGQSVEINEPAAGLSAFAKTDISVADPVDVRIQAARRAEHRQAEQLRAADPNAARLAEALRMRTRDPNSNLTQTSLTPNLKADESPQQRSADLSISNHRIDRSTETWFEDLDDEQALNLPQDFFDDHSRYDERSVSWDKPEPEGRAPKPTPLDLHAPLPRQHDAP